MTISRDVSLPSGTKWAEDPYATLPWAGPYDVAIGSALISCGSYWPSTR